MPLLVTLTVMVGGSRWQVAEQDPPHMTGMMMTPHVDGAEIGPNDVHAVKHEPEKQINYFF